MRRSFCLAFNLNPYRCGGCGWEGLLWEGEGKGWKKVLLAPSTLARLSILLIAVVAVLYGVSFLEDGTGERAEIAMETQAAEPAAAPAAIDVPPPLMVPEATPVRETAEIEPQTPLPPQGERMSPARPAKPKVKLVGNRDSRRYHLPGMKYYDQVKAYHRVEFSSEEEAIAAGYHKAPR